VKNDFTPSTAISVEAQPDCVTPISWTSAACFRQHWRIRPFSLESRRPSYSRSGTSKSVCHAVTLHLVFIFVSVITFNFPFAAVRFVGIMPLYEIVVSGLLAVELAHQVPVVSSTRGRAGREVVTTIASFSAFAALASATTLCFSSSVE
jgi:hypothetical protein